MMITQSQAESRSSAGVVPEASASRRRCDEPSCRWPAVSARALIVGFPPTTPTPGLSTPTPVTLSLKFSLTPPPPQVLRVGAVPAAPPSIALTGNVAVGAARRRVGASGSSGLAASCRRREDGDVAETLCVCARARATHVKPVVPVHFDSVLSLVSTRQPYQFGHS
jgi:hypothetical protein